MIVVVTSKGVKTSAELLSDLAGWPRLVIKASSGLEVARLDAGEDGRHLSEPFANDIPLPGDGRQGRSGSGKRRAGRIRKRGTRLKSASRIRRVTRSPGVLRSRLRRETLRMVPKPVRPLVKPGLASVLSVVDKHAPDVAVVAADAGAERLVWEVARSRPNALALAPAAVAVNVLELMRERRVPLDPDELRRILDPEARARLRSDSSEWISEPDGPRIAVITSSSVVDNERVEGLAVGLAAEGNDVTVLGIHPDGGSDVFVRGGAVFKRLPPRPSVERALAARRRDAWPWFRTSELAEDAVALEVERSYRTLGQRRRGPWRSGGWRRNPGESLRRYSIGTRVLLAARKANSDGGGRPPERPASNPHPLGVQSALRADLERLRPRAMHVCDADVLALALSVRERLRSIGHDVAIAYDPEGAMDGIGLVSGSGAEAGSNGYPGSAMIATLPSSPAEQIGNGTPDTRSGLDGDTSRGPGAQYREPDPEPSLLIGPANSAGQATAWARSLVAAGGQATSFQIIRPDNPFVFDCDITITADISWTRERRLAAFRELADRHTHFLVDGGRQAFRLGQPDFADLTSLRLSRKQVGLIFHGSELRRPDQHAQREEWSPFAGRVPRDLVEALRRRTFETHRALAHFDGPVFVSTPDMLDDLPWAHWLPVVVDREFFEPDGRSLRDRAVPVVVHAPTSSPLKGSAMATPVFEKLHREGVIRYRRISHVPHREMRDIVRDADIVADQFLMNLVGVGAAEGMAAGRVVLANLHGRVRERFPIPPPIVHVTPDTLEDELRSLAADPERREELGTEGREFASTVHDGRMSAQVLADVLDLRFAKARSD